MARPAATQHDVAAALGIAQRTVSRAFAAPETVREELRARIVATAEKLGYRPHAGARTMRTGRCDQVLLVQGAGSHTSNLPDGTLVGLLEGLAAQGVQLAVARFADAQLSDEGFLPAAIRERRSDGLLINYTAAIPAGLIDHIARHRIPAVWINSRQSADCVHPDDVAAGRLLGEHLLGLGHRRVAWADFFVGHDANSHYSRHDRRAGFRVAMTAAGLPALECVPERALPATAFADAARALLTGPRRATAVACYSTVEASAVVLAAASLGLRLPADLSLAVVDDHPRFVGLPLTTAVLDLPELGRQAAAHLLARIAQPRRHLPPRAVAPTLVIADSSAPPSAS